jgi:hypothetical protein
LTITFSLITDRRKSLQYRNPFEFFYVQLNKTIYMNYIQESKLDVIK